jgi:hypothetical protein
MATDKAALKGLGRANKAQWLPVVRSVMQLTDTQQASIAWGERTPQVELSSCSAAEPARSALTLSPIHYDEKACLWVHTLPRYQSWEVVVP